MEFTIIAANCFRVNCRSCPNVEISAVKIPKASLRLHAFANSRMLHRFRLTTCVGRFVRSNNAKRSRTRIQKPRQGWRLRSFVKPIGPSMPARHFVFRTTRSSSVSCRSARHHAGSPFEVDTAFPATCSSRENEEIVFRMQKSFRFSENQPAYFRALSRKNITPAAAQTL